MAKYHWALNAVLLLITLVVSSCSMVYDETGGNSSVEIIASYDRQWMKPYPGCPWTFKQIDSVTKAHPELVPELPQGLRIVVMRPNEAPLLYNLPEEGGSMNLSLGTYGLLCYNNGMKTVSVEHHDSWTDAQAVAGRGIEPEMMFYATIPKVVTECEPVVLPTTFKPAVWSYLVELQVDSGMELVSEARCTLSGMSSGMRLCDGSLINDTTSIPCSLKAGKGKLWGILRSFGTRESGHGYHTLKLVVRLHDKKIITYTYPCTHELLYQPRGGILLIKGVVINPKDAQKDVGQGGFDVKVDSWGPPIIIHV